MWAQMVTLPIAEGCDDVEGADDVDLEHLALDTLGKNDIRAESLQGAVPEESRATTGEGAQGAESCNVIAAASVEGEDGSGKRLDWLGVPVVTTLDWRTPIRAGLPQNAIPLELFPALWSSPASASDSSCDRMRGGAAKLFPTVSTVDLGRLEKAPRESVAATGQSSSEELLRGRAIGDVAGSDPSGAARSLLVQAQLERGDSGCRYLPSGQVNLRLCVKSTFLDVEREPDGDGSFGSRHQVRAFSDSDVRYGCSSIADSLLSGFSGDVTGDAQSDGVASTEAGESRAVAGLLEGHRAFWRAFCKEAYGPGVVFCADCRMWLNSPAQWQEHRIGRKHKKYARRAQRRRSRQQSSDDDDSSAARVLRDAIPLELFSERFDCARGFVPDEWLEAACSDGTVGSSGLSDKKAVHRSKLNHMQLQRNAGFDAEPGFFDFAFLDQHVQDALEKASETVAVSGKRRPGRRKPRTRLLRRQRRPGGELVPDLVPVERLAAAACVDDERAETKVAAAASNRPSRGSRVDRRRGSRPFARSESTSRTEAGVAAAQEGLEEPSRGSGWQGVGARRLG